MSMMKYFFFLLFNTLDLGRLRSKRGVLKHNVEKAMARRAFIRPFRSSVQRVIMRPGGRQATIRANIFMAREVFFRDVLRIQTSEFKEIAKAHTSHTKESFPRSSGHSTSLIRRSTGGQVCVHDEKYDFHHLRTSRTVFGSCQKQLWCADAQC